MVLDYVTAFMEHLATDLEAVAYPGLDAIVAKVWLPYPVPYPISYTLSPMPALYMLALHWVSILPDICHLA